MYKYVSLVEKISPLTEKVKKELELIRDKKWINWDNISIETQRYLVESLARKAKVSIYGLLAVHFSGSHIREIEPVQIREINGNLRRLYEYYSTHPERNSEDIISFMLGKLGFKPFDEISIEEQLKVIKEMDNIHWDKIPIKTQRHLVELLARKAGVSVHRLTVLHFCAPYNKRTKPVVIDEIGGTLGGLYGYYRKHSERKKEDPVLFMLKKLGFKPFKDLTTEEKIKEIKEMEQVYWEEIDIETQKYLVELLAKKAGVSIYALNGEHFCGDTERKIEPVRIEEIGKSLRGLYAHYKKRKDRKKEEVITFILRKLDYKPFDELPVEVQLEAIKEMTIVYWDKIPIRTQKHLVELLTQKAGVSVYALSQDLFIGDSRRSINPIRIEEIDKTLVGLYQYYNQERRRKKRKNTIELMLERLGYKPFKELTMEEQLKIMKTMKDIPWREIPIETQRYLIELLAQRAGVSVYKLNLFHFYSNSRTGIPAIKIEEIGRSLGGLAMYYSKHKDRRGQELCVFMLAQLGFGIPPFNAIGRLYASSRAEYLSQSMYHLLNMMRKFVRDIAFSLDLFSNFSREWVIKRIKGRTEYKGFISALMGENIFGLSSIELLCLALQHVPLDELGIEGTPNYLRPELFVKGKGKGKKEKSKVIPSGSYGVTLRTLEELQWLQAVLEKKIRQIGRNGDSEESFSPKWIQTQLKILGLIPRRIEGKEKGLVPVTAPLACALGKYNYRNQALPTKNDQVPLNPRLDPSQETAARLIMNDSNPLVVVHGPAGAGKTTMLHEAVRQLVLSGKRVLYVTPTHKATDVFMDRVAVANDYRNIPVLRLASRDDKLSTRAKDYWERDEFARKRFRDNRDHVKGGLYIGTMAGGVHYITEGHADFRDYDVVIIDEGSMASKPEVYTMLNFARRAVIVGDHVQLEPFPVDRDIVREMKLSEGQKERVERSLLEELMFAGYPHILLDTNYRAINPVMILLASRIFYDERIRINHDSPCFILHKEDRLRKYPQNSLKLTDTSQLPFAQKREEREGTSYYNEREAQLVIEQVREYLSQGFRLEDIAIITPYMSQVRLIKDKLRRAFPEIREEYLGKWVSTFDGFQGDENKCVIISFVRSNKEHPPETGFVGNYHRVNVGLTRAKERMAIIGDLETLKKTGNGHAQIDLQDNLSQQTRHIFEELERLILELEEEKRAVLYRDRP